MDIISVPRDVLLPNSQGLGAPFEYLINARYGISWGAMGALEDCVHRTREYALERHQLQRPLASFQLVDAQTEVTLGLLASLQVRIRACDTESLLTDEGGRSVRTRAGLPRR